MFQCIRRHLFQARYPAVHARRLGLTFIASAAGDTRNEHSTHSRLPCIHSAAGGGACASARAAVHIAAELTRLSAGRGRVARAGREAGAWERGEREVGATLGREGRALS